MIMRGTKQNFIIFSNVYLSYISLVIFKVEKLQIEKSDMFDSVQILTAKLTEATLAIDNLEEKCVSFTFYQLCS